MQYVYNFVFADEIFIWLVTNAYLQLVHQPAISIIPFQIQQLTLNFHRVVRFFSIVSL